MNRAEKAYRSNANKDNRNVSVKRYNDFIKIIDHHSRSGYGKVANNTIVWRKADGKGGINYQLHATVLATLYPDGSIEFERHGWYTVTTQERLRRLSFPRCGYSYYAQGTTAALFNSPAPPTREIDYSDGVPKLDIWDYSMPDLEGAKYGFEHAPNREYKSWEISYMEYQAGRTQRLHDKYGTFENWRNARREYLRDGRKYQPAMREWVKKYTRECQQGGLYYPGIGWDIKAKDNV